MICTEIFRNKTGKATAFRIENVNDAGTVIVYSELKKILERSPDFVDNLKLTDKGSIRTKKVFKRIKSTID